MFFVDATTGVVKGEPDSPARAVLNIEGMETADLDNLDVVTTQ